MIEKKGLRFKDSKVSIFRFYIVPSIIHLPLRVQLSKILPSSARDMAGRRLIIRRKVYTGRAKLIVNVARKVPLEVAILSGDGGIAGSRYDTTAVLANILEHKRDVGPCDPIAAVENWVAVPIEC